MLLLILVVVGSKALLSGGTISSMASTGSISGLEWELEYLVHCSHVGPTDQTDQIDHELHHLDPNMPV